MRFSVEQTNALLAPLNAANVKHRSQAGRSLSYLEGWKAIEEANRIFGFDMWDRETMELVVLGEPRLVGDKYRVGYRAKVRIRVFLEPDRWITRDGCGFGSGIDKDLDQAHESALKEAETDAMKRGLMTFGNPFGLALYDKEQRNVADEPPPQRNVVPMQKPQSQEDRTAARAYVSLAQTALQMATSAAEVTDWWKSEGPKRKQHGITNGTPEFAELVRLCEAREAEIVDEITAPMRAG